MPYPTTDVIYVDDESVYIWHGGKRVFYDSVMEAKYETMIETVITIF